MSFNDQEDNTDRESDVVTREMTGECWICPYTEFQSKQQVCIKEMSNEDTNKIERGAQFPLTGNTLSNIDTGKTNMIRVYNLPESATRKSLKLFFENRGQTGGGPILEVDFNEMDHTAIITFEDPEAVGRVIQKLPILFNEKHIEIETDKTDDNSTDRNDVENLDCAKEIHGVGLKFEDKTDEVEIREMQTQLQELETELERKRMEENKRNLQQRLDTVRSELQRYNNTGDIRPPAETPLAENSLLQSSDTSVISSADTVDETHVKIAFRDEEEWACRLCTLRNHHLTNECSACRNPRGDESTERVTAVTPISENSSDQVATGPLAPVTTSNIQLPATVDNSRLTKGNPCNEEQQHISTIYSMGARSYEEQRGISTISNQGTDVVPQQQRAPQVPVTDEMEIREMQRQLQEFETELERKRKEEYKRNSQQRLDTVRSELQRYNNTGDLRPSADSLLDDGKIVLRDEDEWICRLCTLRNHFLITECSACGECTNPIYGESTKRLTTDTPLIENTRDSSEWTCSICTLRNARQVYVCEVCRNPRQNPLRKTVENVPLEEFSPDRDDDISTSSLDNSGSKTNISNPDGVSKELRLVLIGSTGQGKSTTGNTILGKKEFGEIMSAESVTKKTKIRHGFRFNRYVNIVDTSAVCNTGHDLKNVQDEILKCIGLTAPGPHAVLLIVDMATRFSLENKESLKFFMDQFGDELYKYLIVVFTNKDELRRNKMSLAEYLKRIPKELVEVLGLCKHRYIAIENNATDNDKDRSIQDLFRLIDHMVEQNNNKFFTNDLYAETEKWLQKRTEKIYIELEQKRVTEIQAIRREQEGQFEKTYQRLVRERKQLVGRNLNQSELADLRAAAKDIRTRSLTDLVKPKMTRYELRRTAQREIEDEKPGIIQEMGRGALKGVGVGFLGILASPFVAIGGFLSKAVTPVTAGAAIADSSDNECG